MIQSNGGDGFDPVGQFKREGVAKLKSRGIVHAAELPGDGIRDLLAVVPRTATPETGEPIEYFTTICTPVVAAIGSNHHPWVILELTIAGKWHPMSLKLLTAQSRRPSWIKMLHSVPGSC